MNDAKFWTYVTKPQEETGCWIWHGYRDRDGYGLCYIPGSGTSRAHRVAYQLAGLPLEKSVPLDHRCHDPRACAGGKECPHRACVNPLHLEVTTPKANAERSVKAVATTCLHGHEFDSNNTYIKPNGTRRCRQCHASTEARRRGPKKIRLVQTHCGRGHDLLGTSLHIDPRTGKRMCRVCLTDNSRNRRARLRAEKEHAR